MTEWKHQPETFQGALAQSRVLLERGHPTRREGWVAIQDLYQLGSENPTDSGNPRPAGEGTPAGLGMDSTGDGTCDPKEEAGSMSDGRD